MARLGVLLSVMIFVLVGCSEAKLEDNVGEVLSINEDKVSIQTNMYEELILNTSEAEIKIDSETVDVSELQVGDKIKFETTGIVTRSLPPQSSATYIEVQE